MLLGARGEPLDADVGEAVAITDNLHVFRRDEIRLGQLAVKQQVEVREAATADKTQDEGVRLAR